MNALTAIFPYKHQGFWVFDDENTGLVQEPFVAGADVIIERHAAAIPDAERGFRLLFSETPFPGFTTMLEWRRAEMDGNWYYDGELGLEGWLCPALYKYFPTAPRKIYMKFEPRTAQVFQSGSLGSRVRTTRTYLGGTTPDGGATAGGTGASCGPASGSGGCHGGISPA